MPIPILGMPPAAPPVPPDPGSLGAIQWLRSDSRVDVAGQCQTLVDLTAFGRDMEATASGLQPSPRPDVVLNVLDGHPALRAASDKRMLCAAFNVPIGTPSNVGHTWGLICQANTASAQWMMFDSGALLVNSDGILCRRTLGGSFEHGIFSAGTAQYTNGGPLNDTAVHFTLDRFDNTPTGNEHYVDFGAPTTTASTLGALRTLDTATLFCQGNTGGAWNGDFFEWFLFDRRLNDADLAALFGYVAARYPSL